MLTKIIRKIARRLFPRRNPVGVRYWRKRAEAYGKRSVYNVRHTEDELDAVTQMQIEQIFPHLKEQLNGDEKTVLDFGCGPGRFTAALAEMIKGKVIGVEPVKELIGLAPKTPNSQYLHMKEGQIPLPDHSIDIAWICIVLGGIVKEKTLRQSIAEINRVLKPNGLVFLVENTTDQPGQPHWKYRSFQYYNDLFMFAPLKNLSHYSDMDEEITIMSGRKIIS